MNDGYEVTLVVNLKFFNDFKPLFILVDGETVLEIFDNGKYSLQLSNQEHKIQARTGFIKSNILSVFDENTKINLVITRNNKINASILFRGLLLFSVAEVFLILFSYISGFAFPLIGLFVLYNSLLNIKISRK
jgi:hypothetical protein